jgi:hypothetical protein
MDYLENFKITMKNSKMDAAKAILRGKFIVNIFIIAKVMINGLYLIQ